MKNRRLFLKSMFSLPFLLTFNHKILAKKLEKSATKNILLNQCSIAGFQYYQGKEVIGILKEDEALKVLAEPENKYDKYAVEVYYQTKKLGYIPRNENKQISRILQAGVKLNAKVHKVDINKKSWDAVVVSVFMQA